MPHHEQIAALRAPLLRFARMQLRDDALAEDAVSDTLLALLEKPGAFQAQSTLRTYATGILKHKVVDLIRKRAREVAIDTGDDDRSLDDTIDGLFEASGHWSDRPSPWGEPEQTLAERQFAQVLQDCVERLPPRLARVLMAREWLEMDVAVICDELGITANNCGVMLYRARMQLRECLDQRWFKGQGQ